MIETLNKGYIIYNERLKKALDIDDYDPEWTYDQGVWAIFYTEKDAQEALRIAINHMEGYIQWAEKWHHKDMINTFAQALDELKEGKVRKVKLMVECIIEEKEYEND